MTPRLHGLVNVAWYIVHEVYVYKGHYRAIVEFTARDSTLNSMTREVDGIANYLEARYVLLARLAIDSFHLNSMHTCVMSWDYLFIWRVNNLWYLETSLILKLYLTDRNILHWQGWSEQMRNFRVDIVSRTLISTLSLCGTNQNTVERKVEGSWYHDWQCLFSISRWS